MIRMTNLRRPLQAGLVAALMSGTVPVAQAADVQAVRVYVGDLRLDNPRGQEQMQRRVEAAIDKLCQPVTSALTTTPRARRLVRECRASAWAGVQRQLTTHGLQAPAAAQAIVSVLRN